MRKPMPFRQHPNAMHAELESDQVITADTTTRLELGEGLVIPESGFVEFRAAAYLKTLGDGTRADLILYVNDEPAAMYSHAMARQRPPTVEQVARDYVYGNMPTERLERLLERAVQFEMDGAPEVESLLHLNHVSMVEEGDRIGLGVKCEERGTVFSGLTGIEVRGENGSPFASNSEVDG